MADKTKTSGAVFEAAPGETNGKEIAGHAIAGIGQNLIFGLWSSYMLVFLPMCLALAAVLRALL